MSDVRDPDRDQPLPVPTGGPSMHDLAAADLEERKAHGLRKYGSLLQTGNGRSFAQDAYEEALDLTVYLRGIVEEERLAAAAPTTEPEPPATVDGGRAVRWFLDSLSDEDVGAFGVVDSKSGTYGCLGGCGVEVDHFTMDRLIREAAAQLRP